MSSIAVDPRIELQRSTALAKANAIRSRRARLKHDLAAGRISFRELLTDVPDWLESMKVFDLMLAVPKVGRVKAQKACNRVGIAPSRQVKSLSQRQVGELISLIER